MNAPIVSPQPGSTTPKSAPSASPPARGDRPMNYYDWLHSCLEEDAARNPPEPDLIAKVMAQVREASSAPSQAHAPPQHPDP